MNETYPTTEVEKQKILSNYFKNGTDSGLDSFPRKEKRKVIVLENIIMRFEPKRVYTEQEINELLKKIFPDFVTIRRALIDYRFMDRSKDGTKYWVQDR